MKQKFLVVVLVLFSIYSFGQTVGQIFAVNGINYVVTKATLPYEVTLGSNTSFVGAATIPASVSNAGNAFSVTSISNRAFNGCVSLTSVTIPNSVTSIGYNAFENCTGLTSVTIPNSVTSIGVWAFFGCRSITSLSISTGVTSIGNYTFANCHNLTSVTIPNSVTNIGDAAFFNCIALTSLTIPSSVASIGESAFNNCFRLQSVSIPNSVTSIGAYAFAVCAGLTSLNIPNSVTSIGDYAFSLCNGLLSVTVNWTSPLTVNATIFNGLNLSSRTLNVPAGRVAVYDAAPVWTDFNPITEPVVAPVLNQIFTANGINYIVTKATLPYKVAVGSNTSFVGAAVIPTTVSSFGNSFAVTSIANSAFAYCTSLTSITIPNSLTSIGERAFFNCTGLTSVSISNSVNSIGNIAFSGCSGLTSVIIPISITSIGESAFSNCSSLTSITIPNSVTRIERDTFNNCTGLTSVTIPNSVNNISFQAFSGCSSLASITIPNSVTTIGHSAFRNCTSLISIIIPNSVTSFGSVVFSNCTSLVSITLPNSITRIDSFSGCSSLSSITIPNSVTTIGHNAFTNCIGLTSITIPNSVWSIESSAFSGCSGLTSITIPNSVGNIGESAFSNCIGLISVTVNWATPISINSNVFNGINLSNITLIVPAGRVAVYDASLVWTDFGSIVEPVVAPLVGQTFTANGINYIVTKATLPYEVAVGSNRSFVGAASIPTNVSNAGNSFAVTSIDVNAFLTCTSLTSVIIPNSVTSIGSEAFSHCSSLTSVTIPNSVTSIGEYAFEYCSGLTSMTISNTITSINTGLFFSCTGLTSVTIPNSVTSIGNHAFAYCEGLTAVTISNSITSVGTYVFNSCKSLTSVTIPNSITSISNGLFYYCTSLSSITIPNSVTSIGREAFEYCIGLTSITIGNAVTSIGENAFSICRGLTSVTVNLTTPLTINANVFSGVSLSDKTLKVPVGSEMAYDAKPVWTDFGAITDVNVEPVLNQTFVANGINYIVTKVNLPFEVAVDSNTNFVGTATIPVTVSNTGDSFAVTRIGQAAFSGCTGLLSVSIPNSVTSIGEGAFSGCTGLTSISIPNSVTSIENSTFGGCSALTSVTIGNAVTSIGRAAFGYCTNLTSIIIPNSVTSIGDHTFVDCTGLTSVNIPNSVTSIGLAAFQNCIGLSSVTVNWTEPFNISSSVFYGLTLSTVTLNVPIGTEILYNSTLGWTDFPSITDEVNYCKGATAQPLTALFTPASTLKWYTVATGGRASTTAPKPTTITVGTKLFYVSLVVNGLESKRQTITVNTFALPTTPGTMTGTASQGALVGTTTTATYTIAEVVNATSYVWTAPTGVNIVSGQGTNTITVNFSNVPAGAGAIGTLSVVAINSNDCSSLARNLALTKALPTAPSSIKMTNAALPLPVSGVATAITTFAPYMGTTTELTLTAKPSTTATSYIWELPTGVVVTNGSATTVGGVTESTSNEITVNFSGVTSSNTYNYMTTATVPVATNVLRIGVKARNGVGVSVTSNAGLLDPTTTSTARLLTLKAIIPAAPASLKMYNPLVSSTVAITDISKFIGTNTELTLTAAISKLASSYSWEIPSTVTVVAGSDLTSNSITINFLNVPAGTTATYLGVKAVNGMGSSVTVNPITLVPATTSEARLLKVTAVAPSIVGTVTGSLRICPTRASDVIYTIATAATRVNTYNITVPMGCTINGGTSNTATIIATSGVTFTVNYPVSFVANNTTAIKTITIQSENGFGVSATNKVLKLTNTGAICTPRLANSSAANEFKVIAYPNPSSSEFTIETSAKGAMSAKVYDMQGRLVEKADTNKVGSKLAAGVYNLIITQDSNVKTLRVIKQ